MVKKFNNLFNNEETKRNFKLDIHRCFNSINLIFCGKFSHNFLMIND